MSLQVRSRAAGAAVIAGIFAALAHSQTKPTPLCLQPATQEGRELVLAALAFVEGEAGDASKSRVAILHNPAHAAAPPTQLQRLLLAATAAPSRRTKIVGDLESGSRVGYRFICQLQIRIDCVAAPD